MTNELRTILVSLHGPDRPGVLAGLMHLLSAQDCEVYDVGQVVIRGRLMLNVLIGVPAEKATVRDLLYFAWEHDLEVDFEVVEPTPTPAKDLSVVTVIVRFARTCVIPRRADSASRSVMNWLKSTSSRM